MTNDRRPPKRSKEEKEKEYLGAIEQVFTYPLMNWQIEALLEIRKLAIEGRVIDVAHYKAWREGL